jgi:surface protein
VTDNPQIVYQKQWLHHDEGALVVYALSFLDVKTLLQMEIVNKTWRNLCKKTINEKGGPDGPKAFTSTQELEDAVMKYCQEKPNAANMEDIACTYGYPIGQWNVSQIKDMSCLFRDTILDECIGSWDVSSVTNMSSMFEGARAFNQDIGSWDVSSVTKMSSMFHSATRFNQDIESWDVSRVTDMNRMFYNAISFNQGIASWDVSSVTNMEGMFYGGSSFNQDIRSWNVSRGIQKGYMFGASTVQLHCFLPNAWQNDDDQTELFKDRCAPSPYGWYFSFGDLDNSDGDSRSS